MKKYRSFRILVCALLSLILCFACAGAAFAVGEENTASGDESLEDVLDSAFSGLGDIFNEAYSAVGDAVSDGMAALTTPVASGNVVDFADLLTDSEETRLLSKIESIKSEYSVDVVLHTTDSIGDKNMMAYTDDFYDYNGYGVGADHSGIILALNMNEGAGQGERDYWISTTGSCINAFTDYAVGGDSAVINSKVLGYLSEDEWYGAFNCFLDLADEFLAEAAKGTPYDTNHKYRNAKDIIKGELIALVVAAVAALFVTGALKKKMSNASQKTKAADYVVPGSLVVTRANEYFTHTTHTRTRRESSSGGGSSTHSGSSGTSHGGGGGKF